MLKWLHFLSPCGFIPLIFIFSLSLSLSLVFTLSPFFPFSTERQQITCLLPALYRMQIEKLMTNDSSQDNICFRFRSIELKF